MVIRDSDGSNRSKESPDLAFHTLLLKEIKGEHLCQIKCNIIHSAGILLFGSDIDLKRQ